MNSMKSVQNEESLPTADRNYSAMIGFATAAVAHRCGGLKRGGGTGLSGARPQGRANGNRSSSRNQRTQDAGDCHLRYLDQAKTGDNFGRLLTRENFQWHSNCQLPKKSIIGIAIGIPFQDPLSTPHMSLIASWGGVTAMWISKDRCLLLWVPSFRKILWLATQSY